MTIRSIAAFLMLACSLAFAQKPARETPETPAQHAARMQWWRDARFGMFIHWGLYSIPAGEWGGHNDYGEWIRSNAQIPLAVYDSFQQQFNPVNFDALAWVRTAKEAGMRYIVITSKHHDGFCLFDSKHTTFDVMGTPFRRDIVRELADACRREGIVFCLYHSIMDWHHPDYLPRREWESDRPDSGANFDRYVLYMKDQLRELLSNYGPLGVLWFDGEWESTWNEERGKDLYAYVRGLQPSIIVNNRVGAAREGMAGLTAVGGFGGDFGTPEQEVPATGIPEVDWESCMTMNTHWGYNKSDKEFKSSAELIRTLTDIASKGGNYLLNVGPTALGEFPQESIDRLRDIGAWMRLYGESIHGTSSSPFKSLPWGRCTQKVEGNVTKLYLHVFDWPIDGRLVIPGLSSTPFRAFVLGDVRKQKLSVTSQEDGVVVRIPKGPLSAVNTVVVLEFEGIPDINDPPEISWNVDIFVDTMSVNVESSRENVQVRYTLDGSEPTKDSPLAKKSVLLTSTTTLSARCYRGQKAVSGTSRASFRKVSPRKSEREGLNAPGLAYEYYEGDWDRVPDYRTLSPVKSGHVAGFTFAPRINKEHFGFVYDGYIRIPIAGVYTVFTSSDDGSKLWIGDSLIVDNDGLHGAMERKGSIALEAGFHGIRVEYFEKTGGDALKVQIEGPGIGKREIPEDMLFH